MLDFRYMANAELKCLKLNNVCKIVPTKYKFRLTKLHVENCNISIEQLRILASIEGLYKIKIKNCTFGDAHNKNLFAVYDCIKDIKCIVLQDKNLDITHMQKFTQKEYDMLKLTGTAHRFEYVRSATTKNKLYIKNTIDVYKQCTNKNDFLSLQIDAESNMTDILQQAYNYEGTYALDCSGCNIVDSEFVEFACKFTRLRHIFLANTHITTNTICTVIDKFASTLQILDLSNVPFSRAVLDYAECKLKSCTIIYNKQIRKYIEQK